MRRSIVLGFFALAACTGTTNPPAAANPCPDAVHDRETWSYSGDSEQCAALVTALNAAGGDSGEACATEEAGLQLVPHGAECTATIHATCDGQTLEATCTVTPAGDADCTARVTSSELDSGGCDLLLRVRS